MLFVFCSDLVAYPFKMTLCIPQMLYKLEVSRTIIGDDWFGALTRKTGTENRWSSLPF